MAVRVKQERVEHCFRNLKRQNFGTIELDSPSPPKRTRSAPASSAQNPDTLPGLTVDEDGDDLPAVGEVDDIELALEKEMDKMEAEAEFSNSEP